MKLSNFEEAVDHYLPHEDTDGVCSEHARVRLRAGVLASSRLLFMGTAVTEEEASLPHQQLRFPWIKERVRRHVAVFFVELHNGKTYYQSLETDSYAETGITYGSWKAEEIVGVHDGVILPHPDEKNELYVPYDPLTIVPGLGGKALDVNKVGDISQLTGVQG